GASPAAAAVKSKRIAVIEHQFGSFFTEIFHKPAKAYLKQFPDWSVTFGNENGSLTTGVNLLNQYVSQNYGVVILSVGQDMSAWQNAVKKAVGSGVIFINHSTQGVTDATQNVLFSHKQAGVDVGNAGVAWAKKNNITAPVVGLIGNLSDAQGKKRTEWAWNTVKATLPNAKLVGQVQGIGTPDGGKAAANL